ncbi:MAG: hypothetical protein HY814_10100 [Candidatus Riflebacteria bacterium]|nr:hypothetical protein [Candidatus Riflebacteria bacterium]
MKNLVLLAIMALVLAWTPMPVLAVDHSASNQIGEAANQEGQAFITGAKKIAEVFIFVGKTTIEGVNFIILKGVQGVVYIAEDAVIGAQYLVKGAKFVIVKTAQGVRWVAVQAIKAGEIIFDAVVDLAELVIEDVAYVLIKLEDGVTFVARQAIKAGKVIIKGIEYVAHETAEGIIWVSKATWGAIKAGAAWTRDKIVAANIRQRLSGALLAGGAGPDTVSYFQNLSTNAAASPGTRRLAGAALAACLAFNTAYAK